RVLAGIAARQSHVCDLHRRAALRRPAPGHHPGRHRPGAQAPGRRARARPRARLGEARRPGPAQPLGPDRDGGGPSRRPLVPLRGLGGGSAGRAAGGVLQPRRLHRDPDAGGRTKVRRPLPRHGQVHGRPHRQPAKRAPARAGLGLVGVQHVVAGARAVLRGIAVVGDGGLGRLVHPHDLHLAVGLGQDAEPFRNRRLGARERVAGRGLDLKVAQQLEALLAQPVSKWALMGPAQAEHERWTAAQREQFRTDLAAALDGALKPGLARYRDAIRKEILPSARSPEKAGLVNLPDGVECYRKRIRDQTSLDLSPEELHTIGLEQVRTIREELSALGQKVMGTSQVERIQHRLRDDPAMQFKTADEVEAAARDALARAKAAIPKWFGVLPKADCEVKIMGMHEAPQSTIAYYRNPTKDGSRPGYYMLNTYKPETRPRYEAQALAFHESIPGHHLQIAIAMELKDLPEFRKYEGVTAFVEGWALYTERLADEMGLYSSDLDRFGMLSYDAWRACRLVVDTGLHAMGWTRQQAIDYMMQNTVLAENNVVNEVDRYITWPGQALAYKCGQIEILKLREEGRLRLGARFDIKEFHDVVLRNGALPLPILRQEVETYYAERERAK
ncbi:MAG: DUF885 domain-containing protein, partial [Candidatus Eisenbacteria bacterium]